LPLDSQIIVTFFGVRGSCPCSGPGYNEFGGNTSCVLIELIDKDKPYLLVLDLGTGVRRLGEYIDSKYKDLVNITAFVTHLHWDHIMGLPFFQHADRPTANINIYGPKQPTKSLFELYDKIMATPFFPVTVRELKASISLNPLLNGDTIEIGPARVTAKVVPHGAGITLGYRIEVYDKSIGYISDHQAPKELSNGSIDENVLYIANNTDLLIHDAQYSEAEFESKFDWGHSTVNYACYVGLKANTKCLCLYHHDPYHKDSDIMRIIKEAFEKTEYNNFKILPAKEGMQIDLSTGLLKEV
jgi:phosphoribosyl 1,2-cyclic phosphodiesterase